MFTALRYYWITAKGYRLRPWASPYLRWRLETFFGGDMHALGASQFFEFLWRERARFGHFLAWLAERHRVQRGQWAKSNPEECYPALPGSTPTIPGHHTDVPPNEVS